MADQDDAPVPYSAFLQQVLQKGILMDQKPIVPTDWNRLEEVAREKMNDVGFKYIRGGAGESSTMDANRLAFRQWKFVPRVLKPTTPRDMSVTLFGQKYPTPVLMAPIGVQGIMHQDKEIGTAQACADLGVPFTMSTAATSHIEELAAAVPDSPKWFQLYWPRDDAITESILKRAAAAGFTTLVVTLDTWAMAWRPADLDNATMPFVVGTGDEVGFSDPVFRKKFAEANDGDKPEDSPTVAGMAWVGEAFPGVTRSWEDLKILRKYWKGPIVLKGVLSAEDAKIAVDHGIEGIIVSNHGGRQLDGAVGTMDVLPEIVEAVGNQITVLIDSGFRTGADIVKALALGAKGVFVGRPVVYGLGILGREGAHAVLAGLLADADVTMGMLGAKTVNELTPALLKKVHHGGDIRSNL